MSCCYKCGIELNGQFVRHDKKFCTRLCADKYDAEWICNYCHKEIVGTRLTRHGRSFCNASCADAFDQLRNSHLVALYSSKEQEQDGVKHDHDKLRIDLFPPEALEGISQILTFGAQKYGDRNWEKGMSWGRLFGALMRHSWAWWRGEDKDSESGYSHLWHAGCCLIFLITYEARKIGKDDRGNH